MATSITILKKIKPPLRWYPDVKDATDQFLDGKSRDTNGPSLDDLTKGENSVLQEAVRILGRCLPPTDPANKETGIVVGYVQSGKTMSFETVITLARDNSYGLVIVLVGTKNNLRDQSEDRLKKDLGIQEGENWYHFSNPSLAKKTQVADRIAAWKKQPTRKKAVLITVLKHGKHLESLAQMLKKIDLKTIPVLVVDDESDQASLNTRASAIRGGRARPTAKSTTHEKIGLLRDSLPHHSYLQYTATPQANLLLAKTDLLTPSFAELVTPGKGYAGGRAFFKDNRALLVTIPANEVPSRSQVVTSVPKSLLSALRFFLLAAAHHSLTRKGNKDRNRSMMVHPDAPTASHRLYWTWVDQSYRTLKSFVQKQYKSNPAEVFRRFQPEYDSLKKTDPQIMPFADLIEAMINDVFDELNWVEVNSTPDAEKKIDWKAIPYWIVVGGAKLDRGYTVEGLCTTYMPRPLGTSPSADTLQQRARFFGYKESYLGLCRVFLQQPVMAAFTDYVDHEEFVRKALEETRGQPLSSWRRDFLLTSMLNPTRPNVVGLGLRRIPVDGWLTPRGLHRDSASVTANDKLFKDVLKEWKKEFGPAVKVSKLERFKTATNLNHSVFEDVPLTRIMDEFLLNIGVKDPHDAEDASAMLIALASLRRGRAELKVDVFLMNDLQPNYRTRTTANRISPMNQYFSASANSLNDKSFQSDTKITLQLRRFNLGTVARDPNSADIFDVPWFALNIPSVLRKDTVIEERNG
jgi:hypothetical protein